MIADALACYRITRLIVEDDLTEAPRRGLVDLAYSVAGRWMTVPNQDATAVEIVASDPHPPKLAKLVTCPYCASIWVGFGIVAARRWAPKTWAVLAEALALSAAASLLAGHES